jgi:hypothetical protein
VRHVIFEDNASNHLPTAELGKCYRPPQTMQNCLSPTTPHPQVRINSHQPHYLRPKLATGSIEPAPHLFSF